MQILWGWPMALAWVVVSCFSEGIMTRTAIVGTGSAVFHSFERMFWKCPEV